MHTTDTLIHTVTPRQRARPTDIFPQHCSHISAYLRGDVGGKSVRKKKQITSGVVEHKLNAFLGHTERAMSARACELHNARVRLASHKTVKYIFIVYRRE